MEEGMTVNESILTNKKLQNLLRFLTALSFALFTSYQLILLFAIEASKIGRLLGIVCFFMISVSSFLALSKNKKVLTASSVLLVIGLLTVFFVKLLNIPGLFGIMSFAEPPTVLNCAVFVLSEAGAVTLAVFYLTLRNDMETAAKRRAVVIMMSAVIALYVACLVMECVLLIKYRVNIELTLKVTLLSRFVYCFGFVGTAICSMLPAPKVEEEAKSGQFVYSEDVDDEIDFVM